MFSFIFVNNCSHFINNKIVNFVLFFILRCLTKRRMNCNNFLFFIMDSKDSFLLHYLYLFGTSFYWLVLIDWIDGLYVNRTWVFNYTNFVDDDSLERDEFIVVELYFGNIFLLRSKSPRYDKESFNGKFNPDTEFLKPFRSL